MNCKEFQHWLLSRDVFTDRENPDAIDHTKGCNRCRNIYNLDGQLEKSIESTFHLQDIPRGLYEQIELTLDHEKPPVTPAKHRLTGLVAVLALILVVVFVALSNIPFRYQNLQQLSVAIVASHLKGNQAMSFTADTIEQATAMLSRELKFNVILPDLTDQGYVLLGGRLCVLDKCKTAYLFYKKDIKISSLFIMDYDHLNFEMADGSSFSNDIKGYHTDIWKEKGQVYAMVY